MSALVLGVALSGCKPVSFHGTTYEPPETAPVVNLKTATGADFSLANEKGSVVLLFFGYTHCPDICPTTLSDWARVKAALGRDASRVRFVFISVDPARDDPATLKSYVSRFDPDFIGATADTATLARIEKSFHVESSREESKSASGYDVTHPSQTFVVDRNGDLRILYSFGMATNDVVSDIRQLLRGA
ncbi:MAG: SCO family protein [Gemmatimonadaceae bacterium]